VDNSVDKRQIFRMNLDAGLNTLDPAYARSRSPIWMTAQLFNGLVALDSQLLIRPAIAHSWDISKDGRTYTFHLRSDVRFHRHLVFFEVENFTDSTRFVRASDFVYSFSRICDPATASTGKWIFNDKIVGLEAFQAGNADTIAGFCAPNDSTFVVELKAPFPPFLGLLAMPYGYVVPREIVEHYGEDFRSHPVGTGPFRFFRWNEGQSLILHRNPDYFEQGTNGHPLPYLDAVQVKFIPSRLSAFIEFVQGKLDFIGDLDASYKDEVLNLDGSIKPTYAEKYQFVFAPQLNTEYLGMQIDPDLPITQDHPLADLRIRKALNYAIDRPKMVRYLLNGMGYPAESGFVPKGMPGFDPLAVPGFNYDLARARQLLAEAGYPNGEGFPELVLNSTQKYAAISEFIQKSFEQLGVRLNIQNLQGGALRAEVYGSRVNFWRASWIADYPDPENYLALFLTANHAPDGPNTTHFSSSEFDQLYQQSQSITQDSARFLLYQEMDRLMLAQAPIIPLYYDRSFRMLQKGITGLSSNPMNHLFLKEVKKD
jgi:oligopeptide transport system substrate-binding protein